ncbi:MAG: OprO/OprP family phosphate-selective porin [Prevotellaceae bacterium]|jgi:hypothetical protein|nr:OprO/OprP family phosphate-selective porin [Prevotellaceae bacterium]
MSKLLRPALAVVLLTSAVPLLAQPDSVEMKKDYAPKIDGIVKVKFEGSLYDSRVRFDVRNSRFGVRGNVSENMSYRTQVEFSNEGKLSVLDAYVTYRLPLVAVSLGQQHYAFSTDLARNPMQNIFANRTFVAKYAVNFSYLADTSVKVGSMGSRDIGGLLAISLRRWAPIVLKVGLFNGSGVNNPVWQESLNISAKAEYGGERGLQAAISYYNGQTPHAQNITMWGGELRYIANAFTLDGEAVQRTYSFNSEQNTLTAAYLQGFYKFYLKPNSFAKYLAPTLRYDIIRNGCYDGAAGQFDAQRVSVGASLGISRKAFKGEIRVSFEKYAASRKPVNFHANPLLHDKVTIEMVAAF